ncbi:hypothetical protein THTE_1751 [Thermogutta terrifontis]|uniref:Mobile element protein n=1 Tax=Thermogutta terrifontis TaxID=1331910 RepID=A0A286REI4_9BACT|nr:hypothetical protein [Thermogutta terrifontis]ASV74353.1 hypothetical protein THTE_1751 [Thermogutta terrifontis]
MLLQKMRTEVRIFSDKAKHLAAAYKLPRERWPELVEWIAEANLTLERPGT